VFSVDVYEGWNLVARYTIHVDPNLPPAPLTDGLALLSAPGLSPAFDPDVTQYTVPSNATNTVPFTATLTDPSLHLYIQSVPLADGQTYDAWAPPGAVIDVTVLQGWIEIGRYSVVVLP
jgi:hypothetical protein